jgi:hypothetical protein
MILKEKFSVVYVNDGEHHFRQAVVRIIYSGNYFLAGVEKIR